MLRSLSPGRCPELRYIALSGLVFLLAIDLIGRKTQNKEMSMVFMSRKMILSQRWIFSLNEIIKILDFLCISG